VTGKVTYRGRPVVYGTVTFHRLGGRTAYSGVIRPDGSYTVEGLPPAPFTITVISRHPSKGRSIARAPAGGNPDQAAAAESLVKSWFRLPKRYETSDTSGLTLDVDSNRVRYDINLE
jgi:hypothetical protein